MSLWLPSPLDFLETYIFLSPQPVLRENTFNFQGCSEDKDVCSYWERWKYCLVLQFPKHLEGRNFSVKIDSKSVSLGSKLQFPTNSTGPRKNMVSFSYIMTDLVVELDSSKTVNLIVRVAVSCKDREKRQDFCFMRCFILLMTKHPHRHRGSCLSCFFLLRV